MKSTHRSPVILGMGTLITVVSLLTCLAAQADESLWLYTKGTDTRPKGTFEAKFSNISRIGKDSGDYKFHDMRPELEYGITDRLTVSIEAMFFKHDYSVNDPELQPMYDTQGGEDERFKQTQFGGYEVSFKYNVLSPYKDAFGLSLGLGYERREKYRLDGAGVNQNSYVTSIFLQKNFLDDTLVVAGNLKTEFERRKSPGVLEEEISLDMSVGVSYRFSPRWFVGMEWRQQSDYLNPQEEGEFNPDLDRSSFDLGDFRVGSRHQYGQYLGPTLHYADEGWWATVGALWQIKGGGSEFSYSTSGRNWDEHERLHLGFTLAYEF